jgi:hypothetical protein
MMWRVRLVTRNGHDWADRLPAVAKAVGQQELDPGLRMASWLFLKPGGVPAFLILRLWYSGIIDGSLGDRRRIDVGRRNQVRGLTFPP